MPVAAVGHVALSAVSAFHNSAVLAVSVCSVGAFRVAMTTTCMLAFSRLTRAGLVLLCNNSPGGGHRCGTNRCVRTTNSVPSRSF